MRRRVVLVVLAGVGMAPMAAMAQAECPPGGWYCEPGEPPAEEGEPSPGADPEAAAPADASAPTVDGSSPPPPGSPPPPPGPPPPPPVIVLDRPVEPPPPPEPAHRGRGDRWGSVLRLETTLLGHDPSRVDRSGMGGLGFGFRYRATPSLAVEASADFVGGRDWAGDARTEMGLLIDGVVFANPDDPVQFYFLGGFGWSLAQVDRERTFTASGGLTTVREQDRFAYFGGAMGLGLEFSATRHLAVDLDLIGFVRGRIDDGRESEPEFVDPDDPTLTTNTSGGGLLRTGIVLYF